MKKNPIIDKLNFVKNGKPTKEEIEKKADKIVSSSMKVMKYLQDK
ncbi:hypothetical protein [Cetobacterium sp.]